MVKHSPWLRPVERLDLALFIGAKNHSMFGRIDVQSNNVFELLIEKRVIAELERFNKMRLEAVRPPDTSRRRRTHAGRFRRAVLAPMRLRWWSFLHRLFQDGLHESLRSFGFTGRSCLVFPDARKTACRITPSPTAHERDADVQSIRDLDIRWTAGSTS